MKTDLLLACFSAAPHCIVCRYIEGEPVSQAFPKLKERLMAAGCAHLYLGLVQRALAQVLKVGFPAHPACYCIKPKLVCCACTRVCFCTGFESAAHHACQQALQLDTEAALVLTLLYVHDVVCDKLDPAGVHWRNVTHKGILLLMVKA